MIHQPSLNERLFQQTSSVTSLVNTGLNMTAFQPDFFQQHLSTVIHDENAPDLDIKMELLGAINYALRTARQNGISRERVVDRMNLCITDKAEQITVRKLNGWTAQSAEDRDMPAKYLPAFMWATLGVTDPLRVIVTAIGMGIANGEDQQAAELGYTLLTQADARQKQTRLKKQFGY